jgi:hypothetical protein
MHQILTDWVRSSQQKVRLAQEKVSQDQEEEAQKMATSSEPSVH